MLAAVPAIMALSPATVGVAVPLFALAWLGYVRPALRWHLVAFATGVALYGVLSARWALAPALATEKALKFALVSVPPALLIGALAMRAAPARIARLALAGIGIATVLLAAQTFADVALRSFVTGPLAVPAAIKINVPAAALAILVWQLPMVARALGGAGRALAGVTALLMAVTAFAGDGLAPRLALIAGAATWMVAYRWPKTAAVLVLAALVSVQVLAPRLADTRWAATVTDASIRHRLDVWSLADELIAARPWLGYGFSNSGVIPAQAGTMPLSGAPRAIPMYPHNVLLQARLELGIPGLVAFFGMVVFLLQRALTRAAVARASALALIAAALSVWCVGYPLWRSTWVAWLWFAAIGWCALERPATGAACRAS